MTFASPHLAHVTAPRRRGWLRIAAFVALVPLLALSAFCIALVDSEPLVVEPAPASALDVLRTKNLYERVTQFIMPAATGNSFTVNAPELNSLLAVVSHAKPGVRGQALLADGGLTLQGTFAVPYLPLQSWLNVTAHVEPSIKGVVLSGVRVGSIPVPDGITVSVARLALDRLLEKSNGTKLLNAIGEVSFAGNAVTVDFGMNAPLRRQMAKRVTKAVRGAADVSRAEDVRDYVVALDQAVAAGSLSRQGSIVPYLAFSLQRASAKLAAGSERDEAKAALLGLALYCGHERFEDFVGHVVPPDIKARIPGCSRSTLAARQDLKLHFIISAGLQVLSDSGAAFAIGEIKELLDTSGGTGFSFDDLAADRAGIRFALAVIDSSAAELDALARILISDSAIFPTIAALPSGMTRQQFEATYKNVESSAYDAVISEIDQRLSALPFFQG